MVSRPHSVALPAREVDAVIFDLDGVVTDTASVHARAWKRLFDEYLEGRSGRTGEPFRPFDADSDYRRYVDGKPRFDGVRSFLESRGIALPEGEPSDSPDRETVCGLGNRKNEVFLAHLRDHGVKPYATTVELINSLRAAGVHTAIISASKNLAQVLEAAGVPDLFEARVGGVEAGRLGLPGKPDPAVFLEAARRLGVAPERAVVVEDALSGVEAGRRGGFALVIGVDRTGHAEELRAAGADVIVRDLGEVRLVGARDEPPAVRDLPSALERREEIGRRLAGRTPAVFLDYDGTLTPIVERPEDALLPRETVRMVKRLAARSPVVVISGRDLSDVRSMVGVEGIVYAGSHGFDIAGPGGLSERRAAEALPHLDRAEGELRVLVQGVPGARLERKLLALAAHYRQVKPERVVDVERAVDEVAARYPKLRKTEGKKIFELRPSVEWDKGRALLWLLEILGLDRGDVVPIYLGDDVTDEDAFRAIGDRGIGIVVRGEDDSRRTLARYALADPREVREFLEVLANAGEDGAR